MRNEYFKLGSIKLLLISMFFISLISAEAQTVIVKVNTTLHPGDTLFLAGSHNQWNPSDSTSRFTKLDSLTYILRLASNTFPADCKVTRGSWSRSEVNSGGIDIENRKVSFNGNDTLYLSIEGWKDDFVKPLLSSTALAGVTIWTRAFHMPQLGRNRTIRIYLPPNYATSGKCYPVVYMHDGQNLFDVVTSFSGEWGVDEIADSLSTSLGLSCIVVGIDNGGDNRIEELTPWPSVEMKVGGRGELYAEFIVNTLKPSIDSAFRTLPRPKTTFVAGSSLGGLMSLYMALKYPSVFAGAIVFSPSLWFTNDIFDLLQQSKIRRSQRFYIYGGQAESASMVSAILKVEAILQAKGVKPKNLNVSISKDGKHSEVYWRREFPAALEWILTQSK